jgi:hypothetical protein
LLGPGGVGEVLAWEFEGRGCVAIALRVCGGTEKPPVVFSF